MRRPRHIDQGAPLSLAPNWCPESTIPTTASSLAKQRFELGQVASFTAADRPHGVPHFFGLMVLQLPRARSTDSGLVLQQPLVRIQGPRRQSTKTLQQAAGVALGLSFLQSPVRPLERVSPPARSGDQAQPVLIDLEGSISAATNVATARDGGCGPDRRAGEKGGRR